MFSQVPISEHSAQNSFQFWNTKLQFFSHNRGPVSVMENNSIFFEFWEEPIIRADGKIMHSEMEYVRQFLRRNFGEIAVSQGEEILLKLFDQAKRMDQENNMGFKNTIRECGTQIAYNLSYEERLQLLAFLAEIAKSDGNVCAAEINALKEVAMAMGMSDREVESMLNLKGSSLDDAYKVLEIEPTATDEEVRAAYRRMAVKHHPDKVASLGEDIRKAANEKFQKINEAKERIYQSRGLK